jgi:hypothetical protein
VCNLEESIQLHVLLHEEPAHLNKEELGGKGFMVIRKSSVEKDSW